MPKRSQRGLGGAAESPQKRIPNRDFPMVEGAELCQNVCFCYRTARNGFFLSNTIALSILFTHLNIAIKHHRGKVSIFDKVF